MNKQIGIIYCKVSLLTDWISDDSLMDKGHLNNNKWKVKSLNVLDTHYVIEKLLQSFHCKLGVVTIKCVHMVTIVLF